MDIRGRLAEFRKQMEKEQMDLYYVPTNDFHGSEYISDYFKVREFLSGFDGSAGELVITQQEAGLWTDGRYFLQAKKQLEGSGITLYRSGQEGVIKLNDFIYEKMPEGGKLGCDGRLVSQAWAEGIVRMLSRKSAGLVTSPDIANLVWKDRPELLHQKAWILSEDYAGESRQSKLQKVRKFMEKWNGSHFILNSLDDIAWLLNIRGNDIPCNPVVLSYLVVEKEQCFLFAGNNIFGQEQKQQLEADGIILREYDAVYDYAKSFPQGDKIFADKRTINHEIVENFPKNTRIVDMASPVTYWKSIKNETEIANEKDAHIKDGVAVTRFIYWLKKNIGKETITEISAAQKLEAFRMEGKHYLGPSFDPIAGYGAHGAIVHYSATKETNAVLKEQNFLLLDTGGQYMEGTTDITRTILLGKPTKEQQKYYTAVLRGNLNLCNATFLYGCSGVALDYAAREPLWEMGCDYNHGTGHGVGYLLNVHEGNNAFRYRILPGPGKNPVLEAGMITSDEPGIYLEGKFGIRLENLILCVKKEKNEFGQFMGFEPLTYVPFDRAAIDISQMNQKEIARLNAYHREVYEKISPYLNEEEKEWLQKECEPFA